MVSVLLAVLTMLVLLLHMLVLYAAAYAACAGFIVGTAGFSVLFLILGCSTHLQAAIPDLLCLSATYLMSRRSDVPMMRKIILLMRC